MFQKISGFENFFCRRGGVLRFFSSHTAEKFHMEPFGVLEDFCFRKTFCIRWGITIFRPNFFCLTVPKLFVEEPFSVSENFWFGKIFLQKRGRIKIFFVSHCRKIS